MSTVLVVAPHADDESYGCGGTLLRHIRAGDDVHWLLMTAVREQDGWSATQEAQRRREIEAASDFYGFRSTTVLEFPTTRLDKIPVAELVGEVSRVAAAIQPSTVYLPFPGDAHTDHRMTFTAASPLAKHFRYPTVCEVLLYETLSETDFGHDPSGAPFRPQRFVNITDTLQGKLDAIALYPGEAGEHPFPRSPTAVESLARLRGAASGFEAAEAFMVLLERRR